MQPSGSSCADQPFLSARKLQLCSFLRDRRGSWQARVPPCGGCATTTSGRVGYSLPRSLWATKPCFGCEGLRPSRDRTGAHELVADAGSGGPPCSSREDRSDQTIATVNTTTITPSENGIEIL